MNNQESILTCKNVKFYSEKDKEAFFEWTRKIECVENISGSDKHVIIHLMGDAVHDFELRDLLALFYRYKVDMKQLKRFLTIDNKRWFFDNKKAYWYNRVFGAKSKTYAIQNPLILRPVYFYSQIDEDLFFYWLNRISCIEDYRRIDKELHLAIVSRPITFDEYKNIMGLFIRYNFDNPEQLKERFITKENQSWLEEMNKGNKRDE